MRISGNILAAAGVLEMVAITLQAARGVRSHFNIATPFDAAIFSTMGIAITVLWVTMIVLAAALLRSRLADRPLAAALRIGFIAAVIGITYVLQFKEIKAKHLVFFFTRLPSLQILDVMNSRTVFIGWLLMTIGLGSGAIWVSEALAIAPDDPRVQAMSMTDPKIFVALVTWAIYTFQLIARRVIGWRGRPAAYLSAAGFTIVLLNFVLVSYFLTESHNFGAARHTGPMPAQAAAVRSVPGS